MADGYWNQQRQQHHPPGGPMKRPRSDFDSYAPSLLEINNACRLVEAPSSTMTIGHGGGYYPRDEDLDVPDTRTIGSAYDRYLQSVQSGEGGSVSMGRSGGGGGGGGGNVQTIDDFMLRRGGVLPLDHGPNGHTIGFDPPEPVGNQVQDQDKEEEGDDSGTLWYVNQMVTCGISFEGNIHPPFPSIISMKSHITSLMSLKQPESRETKMRGECRI
ncbi:Hypothetical protein [Arabidopsis thaliana]|nr:Hypothetical protein [Arabidopsis thaliana]